MLEQKILKQTKAHTAPGNSSATTGPLRITPDLPFRRLYVGFEIDSSASVTALFWRCVINFVKISPDEKENPFRLVFACAQSSDAIDGSIPQLLETGGTNILPPFTVERVTDYNLDYSPSGAPGQRDELLVQVATSGAAGVDLVRMQPIPLYTRLSIGSIEWSVYSSTGTGNWNGIVAVRSSEVPA